MAYSNLRPANFQPYLARGSMKLFNDNLHSIDQGMISIFQDNKDRERISALGGIYPEIGWDEHQRRRLIRSHAERKLLIRGNATFQPGDGIEEDL